MALCRWPVGTPRPCAPLPFVMPDDDDDEDDAELIEKSAREIIDVHGAQAESWVREQAEIADAHRDRFSAETWCEIAEAVKRLLS